MTGYGDPIGGWKCKCARPFMFRKDQLECPFCEAQNPNPPKRKEALFGPRGNRRREPTPRRGTGVQNRASGSV